MAGPLFGAGALAKLGSFATDITPIANLLGIGGSKPKQPKDRGTELTQSSLSSVLDASKSITGGTTEQLQIDEAGIQKIIADVLGGADGLASIFAGEQTAGVFNSSVSAQAAGDLATRLAGEIAKLTAKRVTTKDEEETQRQTTLQDETGTTTRTLKVLDPSDPTKELVLPS